MTKKILIAVSAAIIVTLLAGVWISAEAAAKNPEIFKRFRKPAGALGQVSSATTGQLVITKRSGEEVSYLVDENTTYRDRAGNELTSSDLEQDNWVIVLSPRGGQNNPEARLVVILPDDFDPENMVGAKGVIASVDEDASQVTLKTRVGEELVINFGPETIFKGQAPDISSLQEGMWARIFSQKLEAGGLMADAVRSTDPVRTVVGEIVNVNEDSQTLTILTRRGQDEVTVTLDASTRFRSRDESISSIGDLEQGMSALIITKTEPGSEVKRAVLVAAAQPEDLPQVDRRVFGELISIEGSSITVEARDGRKYVFVVDENTKFRSRNGQLSGLEDLTGGMTLFVAGNEAGSDSYQALVVAQPLLPRP